MICSRTSRAKPEPPLPLHRCHLARLLGFAPRKHLASFGVHKVDELAGETAHRLV
jgi:hypothetical protein